VDNAATFSVLNRFELILSSGRELDRGLNLHRDIIYPYFPVCRKRVSS
jgi:hypothetical protein